MANYNINSRLYNGKGENDISNSNIINKSNIYKFSNFTGIMFLLLVLVNYSLSHGTENEAYVCPRPNYPNKATKFINLNWAKNKARATRHRPPTLLSGIVKGNINDEFKIANVRCKIEDNKIVQLDNIISNIDYLGFRKKKYAIFDIITKKEINGHIFFSDNIYVYSSDINSLTHHDIHSDRGIFSNRNNLSQVKVIACNTDNVTNMSYMFCNCRSLTILDLSKFNTNDVTNMFCMFSGCSSLTELDLSNFNTNKVTDMSCMFYNCSSLTNLDLSSFNTNNVIDMSRMFANCRSLTALNLSNFKTDKVTNMRSMFYNCSSLTNLDLSNFNTTKVTDMFGMFSGCRSLTKLDLSSLHTNIVKDMRCMFSWCRSLKKLNLSNFNTDNVTNMSNMIGMFYECFTEKQTSTLICKASTIQKITENKNSCLIIPNEKKAEINDKLKGNLEKVYTCNVKREKSKSKPQITAVEEYKLGKISYDGKVDDIQIVNEKFADANLVKYVQIVGNEDYKKMINDDSFIASIKPTGEKYLSAYVEVEDNGTVKLRCFIHCTYVNSKNDNEYYYGLFQESKATKIKILSCGSEIEDMFGMFKECQNLKELDLSKLNTSNVTDMRYMFFDCSSLTNIKFSNNFNTNNVKDMNYMFAHCISLNNLDLSSFNTTNVTNMSCMFSNCTSLTNLDLSNFNTNNVTNMSWMFFNCSKLSVLNLSNFNTDKVTNMSNMFYNCSSLTNLDLSNFNTNNVTDMFDMFDMFNMLGMFNKCFTEEQPSTLICKASTIQKITDEEDDSCLTITNENGKKTEINDKLNGNLEKVYKCSVKRKEKEIKPQIIAVEEYKQQQ